MGGIKRKLYIVAGALAMLILLVLLMVMGVGAIAGSNEYGFAENGELVKTLEISQNGKYALVVLEEKESIGLSISLSAPANTTIRYIQGGKATEIYKNIDNSTSFSCQLESRIDAWDKLEILPSRYIEFEVKLEKDSPIEMTILATFSLEEKI